MLTITYYFLMAMTINGHTANAEVVSKYETKKECEAVMKAPHRELAESVDGELVCVKITIKRKGEK